MVVASLCGIARSCSPEMALYAPSCNGSHIVPIELLKGESMSEAYYVYPYLDLNTGQVHTDWSMNPVARREGHQLFNLLPCENERAEEYDAPLSYAQEVSYQFKYSYAPIRNIRIPDDLRLRPGQMILVDGTTA